MARKLSDKRQRFIEEYPIDMNATAAAKRAGYSEQTAYAIGHELLKKPEIRKAIDERLKSLTITAEETTLLISDTAKVNLSDYFSSRMVEHTPRIKVGLKSVIEALQTEIDFENEYAGLAGYNADEMESHRQDQERRRRRKIKLEIELKRNPQATRIVDGPVELVETKELDINKIVADKKAKIKSIKPGQYGPMIELLPADAAQERMGRIHGLFAKDNEQSKPVYLPPMNDDQVNKIVEALKKGKKTA